MFHVYILKSLKKPDKTYVGMTIKEPKDREKEHNRGLCQSTKTYIPWKLIYFENFYCRLCAEKREIFLKSGFGFKFRKFISENYRKIN